MKKMWHGTILGEPCSKANSRRAVAGLTKKGKAFTRFIKSKSALAYVEQARQWVEHEGELLQGDLSVVVTIYYASRRKDLDESVILDLLQGLVYKNDSQIVEKYVAWCFDKVDPRAVVTVTELGTWRKARKT